MSGDTTINNVAAKVGGAFDKVNKAADALVKRAEGVTDETIQKMNGGHRLLDRVEVLNKQFDEMWGGDNGGPVLDPLSAADVVDAAEVVSRPGAATAAKPQPSTLGGPAPIPDWVRKP